MHTPFDPHPNWRRNFLFTAAYKNVDQQYTLDPVIAAVPKATLEFKLDPVIENFTLCAESIKS